MLLHPTHITATRSPADWALALRSRCPLVLAPASTRGWFDGRAMVAWDPIDTRKGLDLAEVAASLEATFDGRGPALTAVLAPFEGPCTVVQYGGAVELAEDGWHARGALPPSPLPASFGPSCLDRCASALPLFDRPHDDLTGREYRACVRDVRERIAAGDVYVLNLTYRIHGETSVAPASAFATLLERAGSDFSAFLQLPDGEAVASVSPECFLRLRTVGEVRFAETRPIKGTRPRGASPEHDRALIAELLADPKERAEHVMIVDLERNDLGRVCVPGTVRVDPLYEVVPTPYCHQLVSTVKGELRRDVDFAEVLSATFPCGSVTGAPKIAAMRIIGEIETSPRGAYCGALLVAMPGMMDSSVLIRTLEYEPRSSLATPQEAHAASRSVRWGTGGGITIESDPASEWLETLVKASPVSGDGGPGVALLETCRVAFGRVALLDRHLARLAAGGCGPSLLARVRARVDSALEELDQSLSYARLRILVHPDRHVAADVDSHPSLLAVADGPVLVPHSMESPPSLPPGAAKPAARAAWDLAHAAALARGGHQAALVMPDDTIVDGSSASIWIRLGTRLLTPPSPPAVDGVARSLVFDLARGLGYRAEEATLRVPDLERAEEVFLSNALAGVVAVRDRNGPASAALEAAFERVWRSRVR